MGLLKEAGRETRTSRMIKSKSNIFEEHECLKDNDVLI